MSAAVTMRPISTGGVILCRHGVGKALAPPCAPSTTADVTLAGSPWGLGGSWQEARQSNGVQVVGR